MVQTMNNHSLFTSSFKINVKFFVKLMIAAIMIIVYIFFIIAPEYEGECTASLVDKVGMLKSINEPKIVLIGNSNLTFGINSKWIEDELGMPVVNMGLHGGLGNAFHEELAKFNVTKGDIYIVCHNEYDDDNSIPQPVLAWITLENHFDLWKVIRTTDINELLKGLPVYLKRSLGLYASGTGNIDPGGVYARSAYNEHGDVGILREGNEYLFSEDVTAPKVGTFTVERINELNKYLSERGATLLVAGYPIANGSRTVHTDEFIAFQKELISALDCAVISNYADYMFDYKYFYDTEHHLNSEGANIRTEQLIYDIQRWKKSNRDASIEEDRYIDIIADNQLSHIADFNGYIEALNLGEERYAVIFSLQNINENAYYNVLNLIMSIFEAEASEEIDAVQAGVVERGKLSCKADYEAGICEGILDDSLFYSISGGKNSSILLNGQEYSKRLNGVNLVIYSHETHRIIDELTITFNQEGIAEILR